MLRRTRGFPSPPLIGARRSMPVRRSLLLMLALLTTTGLLAAPSPARGAERAQKVAIIVGPVGEKLTPVYIKIADAAADRAEASGATVARAYSPEATPEMVLAAVNDANIVIYLGHGVGFPNPYSDTPNPASINGWALQGPAAHGDHSDSWRDGTLRYYGEAWIAANAHPAPGWVMIYSNACYAAGAGEEGQPAATRREARTRVAGYARTPLEEMGASAYFATDLYEGAAQLVGAILDHPERSYGEIYASETRFRADAVRRLPYPGSETYELWLQHSAYFDGQVNYWYSFAGDPRATPAGTRHGAPRADVERAAPTAPVVTLGSAIPASGIVRGRASSYAGEHGRRAEPTVTLPIGYGGRAPGDEPQWVTVCADRCERLPVVDSCPCYFGTADARVANLSRSAWRLVSDAPIREGLIRVKLYLRDPPRVDLGRQRAALRQPLLS